MNTTKRLMMMAKENDIKTYAGKEAKLQKNNSTRHCTNKNKYILQTRRNCATTGGGRATMLVTRGPETQLQILVDYHDDCLMGRPLGAA